MKQTVVSAPLPKVRRAKPEDFEDLINLGMELHRENGVGNLDFDMISAAAINAINCNHAVVGCIGPVGRIEGAIHLAYHHMWYTKDWHLEELWSYVRPQYRKSQNAKALIEFAKRCATELNMPLLIGIVSNERTEQKIALYKRRLGKPSGAFFLYNGKTGVG